MQNTSRLMRKIGFQGPLSEDELDRLSDFLDTTGEPAKNLEWLDGYFAALICGSDLVLPSEYLPEIWGEEFDFQDERQAADVLDLFMRHWNTIAGTLQRKFNAHGVYMPILMENADGTMHGNDWAKGFMRGVSMRLESWQILLEDEEKVSPLLPMMMLAHEHDPDPAMRPEPITPDKRDEVVQLMIAGLPLIYRYFEPLRRSGGLALHTEAHRPMRRMSPKIGRNDFCPCGSGKKHKRCCAGNMPTIH